MAAGLLVVAGVVAVVVLGSGSSKKSTSAKPVGDLWPARLGAVPTNHVTGAGKADIRLKGNLATVTLHTNGLLNGAPHAMHIHAGKLGQCPPATAAHLHNGHEAISTTNGASYYGPPRTSLTTKGDTSQASILAFPRYPATGDIGYSRTFKLTPKVARFVKENNAVIVVHGIDFNGNGVYDGSLDRSELNPDVQGETTAPALCGPLVRSASGSSAQRQGGGGAQVYAATLAVQATAPLWLCHLSGPTS